MRLFITISLLFVTVLGIAQVDTSSIKSAILKLDEALIKQDSAALEMMLDGKLSYGHSNGWVQSKADVWIDFKKGVVGYNKITNSQMSFTSIGKDWVSVRMTSKILGSRNKTDFDLNLHVLQVWKKDKKGWQLVARQSTKL